MASKGFDLCVKMTVKFPFATCIHYVPLQPHRQRKGKRKNREIIPGDFVHDIMTIMPQLV